MSIETKEYLTFLLDQEEYGVDILDVREVRGWTDVRRIPNTEAYLLGVLDLRGEYVPIVDLRQRFGMGSAELKATTVVIVLHCADNGSLGIIVDAVSEVYQLSQKEIKKTPQLGSKVDHRFIEGIASVNNCHVVLIKIEQLFDFSVLHKMIESNVSEEEF